MKEQLIEACEGVLNEIDIDLKPLVKYKFTALYDQKEGKKGRNSNDSISNENLIDIETNATILQGVARLLSLDSVQ